MFTTVFDLREIPEASSYKHVYKIKPRAIGTFE